MFVAAENTSFCGEFCSQYSHFLSSSYGKPQERRYGTIYGLRFPPSVIPLPGGLKSRTPYISRINGGIWGSFGLFACSVALFTILYSLLGDSPLTAIVLGATLTAQIVLLFGIAETISGIVLKNWTIKIAGWITGIGGLAIFYIAQAEAEQLFIFTFAGIVLAATGLIVKQQYK